MKSSFQMMFSALIFWFFIFVLFEAGTLTFPSTLLLMISPILLALGGIIFAIDEKN
jgi:hypothetical protein